MPRDSLRARPARRVTDALRVGHRSLQVRLAPGDVSFLQVEEAEGGQGLHRGGSRLLAHRLQALLEHPDAFAGRFAEPPVTPQRGGQSE